MEISALLHKLGVDRGTLKGRGVIARSPIDGAVIAELAAASPQTVADAVEHAHQAFLAWRNVPAPKRGELITCSATSCARPSRNSENWSASRPARFCRKGSVKCRR